MYCWNLTKQDCNLCILPLFHYGALGTSLSVMQAGGTNIILPKFDADLALKHIREDKVTLFGEFPPILTTLLDRAKEANDDLSTLRVVVGLDQIDTIKRFTEMTGGTFWAFLRTNGNFGFGYFISLFRRPGFCRCTWTYGRSRDHGRLWKYLGKRQNRRNSGQGTDGL